MYEKQYSNTYSHNFQIFLQMFFFTKINCMYLLVSVLLHQSFARNCFIEITAFKINISTPSPQQYPADEGKSTLPTDRIFSIYGNTEHYSAYRVQKSIRKRILLQDSFFTRMLTDSDI